ncbi:MAG: hypothetical protein K2G47_06660 [Muribaculum sp.]|nr:hypothetical protein [Muribaculum sp.]
MISVVELLLGMRLRDCSIIYWVSQETTRFYCCTDEYADITFRFILIPLHGISCNTARNTTARASSEQNTNICSTKMKKITMKKNQTPTD